METVRETFSLEGVGVLEFFGVQDVNLRILRRKFKGVEIAARGKQIVLQGPEPEVKRLLAVLRRMLEVYRREGRVDEWEVLEAIERQESPKSALEIVTPKRRVVPMSENQAEYLRAIEEYDIVFGIGPAGTGKTYLAVAMALKFLREGRVERIILTRPAVEAGESLGYLPGTYVEKIYPYLIPLYDALYSFLPHERVQRLEERRVLEIAPLAYMRGRTLSDAFIILDEAQNTRPVQMKMFLTRLGPRSRVVVTGDVTQIDLPKSVGSGLVEAERILRGVEGIKFVYFSSADVVRHRLVKRIIDAYEKEAPK